LERAEIDLKAVDKALDCLKGADENEAMVPLKQEELISDRPGR